MIHFHNISIDDFGKTNQGLIITVISLKSP